MADCSEVWIWVETEVASPKLTVVEELVDATVLQTSDAEQVSRKANQEYSKCLWQPVPCKCAGEFVVPGELRSTNSR
jgi:hypothetical protein